MMLGPSNAVIFGTMTLFVGTSVLIAIVAKTAGSKLFDFFAKALGYQMPDVTNSTPLTSQPKIRKYALLIATVLIGGILGLALFIKTVCPDRGFYVP